MIYYSKKNINKLSNLLDDKINLVDVGSQGGLTGWLKDIESKIKIINFDFYNKGEQDNFVLFDKISKTNFYECRNKKQSSLFKPNTEFSKYENQTSRLKYNTLKNVNTSTLDGELENRNSKVDIIKIDTQGSEYEILKGSMKTILKDKPLIFVETWTLPIYEGINLFDDIIKLMYQNNYEIWGIDEASSLRLDISSDFKMNNSRRRLSGVNIFFSPNFNELNEFLTPKKLEHYSFLFFVHGYLDWSWKFVKNLENSKYRSELKKVIYKEFSFSKYKYLKFVMLDIYKRIFKKKNKERYKKFT